jgi:hypothetical protein
MGFAGRFRWCFYWSWDLQDVSADVFIGHGICRAAFIVIKSVEQFSIFNLLIFNFPQAIIWRKPI